MDNRKVFTDEQIAQFSQRTTEFTRAIAEALAAVRPVLERGLVALRPFMELANSPAGQAMIAAHEKRKAAGLCADPCCAEACHCLCAKNHPDQPLCRGEVPAGDVGTLRYDGGPLGPVDVPMCPPCAQAALAAVTV